MFVNKAVLFIFAAIIVVADICLLLNHDRLFSERENRSLQQAPGFSIASVESGKFMKKTENFVSDQFFLRDGWISYKYTADVVQGKKDVNGVWLGKNGYLIEDVPETGNENMEKSLDAIKKFAAENQVNTVMSVIPNAAYICSGLLPEGAPVRDQEEIKEFIKQSAGDAVKYADVSDILKAHNKEYIYYKSDHHWTSLGALYAFEALAGPLGITEPVSDCDIYCVTNRFSGTLASASGAADVHDDIHIYVPKSEVEYVVEYVGENKKSATVYDSEALETVSKYDVFFGGNHALIKIRTSVKNGKNLLVLKDSYANALVQFLLPYYEKIYIVDPRYFSDSLNGVMAEEKTTDILFLYNINTFIDDNSLAGVLAGQ